MYVPLVESEEKKIETITTNRKEEPKTTDVDFFCPRKHCRF